MPASVQPRLRLEGITLALHARVDPGGLLVMDGGQLVTITAAALPSATQLALVLFLGAHEDLDVRSQSIQVRVSTPAAGVEVVATIPFMLGTPPTYVNSWAKITQVYSMAIPLPVEGIYAVSATDTEGLLGATEFVVRAASPG